MKNKLKISKPKYLCVNDKETKKSTAVFISTYNSYVI